MFQQVATSLEVEESQAGSAILRALAYFDIFDHPLTEIEIFRFAQGQALASSKLTRSLIELKNDGFIEQYEGYWGLQHVERNVQRRIADEQRASARKDKAYRMSQLISKFPFIRAVFISGSFSKGRLASDGDLDFFIITSPGRLWLARTLLILYKKVFLLNDRRNFCLNYFIDTEHLTIEDKNRFTAVEVVTLLPMYGNGVVDRFFNSNEWAFREYPNVARSAHDQVSNESSKTKIRLERSLLGVFGERLDATFMRLTWSFWKWKFSDLDPQTFDLAMRTRTYVSKHHPRNFQEHVLKAFDQRISKLEKKLTRPLC